MTPSRPYLLRAFYEWLVDNDLTPHLVADANLPGVRVPQQYIQNGQIVLNVAPSAIAGLVIGNDQVTFNARFGGAPYQVNLPIAAVQAIYARENGAGTVFEDEPGLSDENLAPTGEAPSTAVTQPSTPEVVADSGSDKEPADPETSAKVGSVPDDKPPKKGKPTLRVIK